MHPSQDDAAAASAEHELEENELVRFERAADYMLLLNSILPSHPGPSHQAPPEKSKSHTETLDAMSAILDEYQEQPYLLDPYLEQMVVPPIAALQAHIRSTHLHQPQTIVLLSRLVYLYTKVRGYKTITNFFPHEVADLAPTLTFLESLSRSRRSSCATDAADPELASCWELRYVLLLWMSLVCMIPFDLNQFDVGERATGPSATSTVNAHTTMASRIEQVGRTYLSSPGKERDAAAVMLGKLFQRRDVYDAQFEAFAAHCSATLVSQPSPFAATGILQALCEIVKTNDPAFVTSRLPVIQAVLDLYDDPDRRDFASNGLVTKFQTKLTCRLGLKLLRPRKRRRFIRIRTLDHVINRSTNGKQQMDEGVVDDEDEDDDDNEEDVPQLIDGYISKLIDALQHKDTVVRYSAAKGLARLCERLPRHFISQVTDAVVSLFYINVPDLYEGARDLSSVSECTWQGACMALAEQARRGLLLSSELDEKLEWIGKALLFDVRRGAHSVGSNVRDAACYVVWALARAHDADVIRPYALSLAQKLVAVATLDREVSIRRAASAAFQECVGRLDLFPNGIDVIRITDFYAVSVRKNAFLQCAVEVARMKEYRGYLMRHLLDVTVVHWDVAMRRLGAAAVAHIVAIDFEQMAAPTIEELCKLCASKDSIVVHGALLSLAEIAFACAAHLNGVQSAGYCAKFFTTLDALAAGRFRRSQPALVLDASCKLVEASFRLAALAPPATEAVSTSWRMVVDRALQDPEDYVHNAAAKAVASASRVAECTFLIDRAVDEWKTLGVTQQQSHTLVLGSIDYSRHLQGFERAWRHLVAVVDSRPEKVAGAKYSANVETRRNAYLALPTAVRSVEADLEKALTASDCTTLFHALLEGLADYTSDQRGDVGSWIRIACLEALTDLVTLLDRRLAAASKREYLDEGMYDAVVAAMLKQAVERIDHLRSLAVRCVVSLWRLQEDGEGGAWRFKGRETVRKALLGPKMDARSPQSFYPRAIALLCIDEYRSSILHGLLVAVGSKSDLGQRIILKSLCTHLTTSGSGYTTLQLIRDLTIAIRASLGKNNIVVPALSLLCGMLESGILPLDATYTQTKQDLRRIFAPLHTLTTRTFPRLQSPHRITETIRLNCLLLTLPLPIHEIKSSLLAPPSPDGSNASAGIRAFLTHRFPATRNYAAEYLYTLVSVADLDETEQEGEEEREGDGEEESEGKREAARIKAMEVLESVRWASSNVATYTKAADDVVETLRVLFLS
ncbi:hypothetical protein ACQY0O_004201 [Thecaphora frezii]